MADTKISALTALTGANTAPDDVLPIVDTSVTTTKSITRQELQTYNAGTLTTDVKVLDLSATWNAGAVTFTGLKFNVTDTASATASLIVDLLTDGVSQCSVTKAGLLTTKNLTASGGGNSFNCNGNINAVGNVVFGNGFATFTLDAGNKELKLLQNNAATAPFVLTPGSGVQLEQRNGTNAQTFNLYRTYTDASNYQRLAQTWNTTTALIHNEGAGTGADGSIAFNNAALATNATKGFIMIPSCAGTPTGTPADIPTGQVPIVFDSTNNKIYVYDGSWLATAALT